jgi:hypothetical protein
MWRYVILQWYTATRLQVPPLCYNSGHSSYSLIQTGGTSTTLPWLHDLHTVLWWLSFLLMHSLSFLTRLSDLDTSMHNILLISMPVLSDKNHQKAEIPSA